MTEQNKRKPADDSKSSASGKTPKAKLIRLDDLIPKQNVEGGQKSFFGSTRTP